MNPDTTVTRPPKARAASGTRAPAAARSSEGKERILLASLEEFAARGFDGASTTAIARRSNVTQPLIHYHFGSKEGLWRATMDDLFRRLGKEFLEAIRAHPPAGENARATFLALMREFVRFCARYPQFARLLYMELPVDSPRSAWLKETWVKPVAAKIVAIHAAFARESGMKEFPAGHVMAAITGAAATPFALGSFMLDTYGLDPASEAMIEQHASLLVTMLESGLFKPA